MKFNNIYIMILFLISLSYIYALSMFNRLLGSYDFIKLLYYMYP